MATFRFVGKVDLNALDSKLPYMRKGKTGKGADYASFNMSVAPEKNNRAFVEVFGMKQDVIKTMNTDNEKIEINWEDRNDSDVVKQVAFYKRFFIELNGEKKEFISSYDYVQYLIEHADEIKGKEFIVRGSVNANVYNGNVSFRYSFSSMTEIEPDSDVKREMMINSLYFWGADDIDTADWKKQQIINVNAYTYQYIDKDTGSKYVPTPFVIDVSKADLTNEKVVKVLSFKLKQLGMELVDGNIKTKIKKNTIVSLPIDCAYLNGNKEIEFDESQLNENQKMAIELGINTIDDFRPKGSIYGTRITILKFKDCDLRDPYNNGCKVEDISLDDFNKEIFATVKEETVDDIETADDTSDIDELFS